MKNWNRIIPYISLGLVSIIVFGASQLFTNIEIKNILISVFSSSIFFFLAYLFYDLIRQIVLNKEKKYLVDYIKNKISNDIFVALYFLKKIIHGYNLDSNTLENIFNIVNYSKNEILNSISILRIANNLARLESILKNENNFGKCAESGIEFTVVNGRDINPDNDEKHLLFKKTVHSDRFVVYDSGFFCVFKYLKS